MFKFSQNNKIALSAVAIFAVSFIGIAGLLNNTGDQNVEFHTAVLDSVNTHTEEVTELTEAPEELYAQYLEDSVQPYFVIDSEGNFKYVDKTFCELLSVDCEKLMGSLMFDYVNSKDLPDFVSDHTKLMKKKDEIKGSGPYRMIKGDSEIFVMMDLVPVLEKKEVEEIVIRVKDITGQVEELHDGSVGEDGQDSILKYLYPKVEMIQDGEASMILGKLGYR